MENAEGEMKDNWSQKIGNVSFFLGGPINGGGGEEMGAGTRSGEDDDKVRGANKETSPHRGGRRC